LRFVPRELRRTEVRLVPQDLRALILAFLRRHPPNFHQASRATATVSFRSLFFCVDIVNAKIVDNIQKTNLPIRRTLFFLKLPAAPARLQAKTGA
jgi:hypothetical protein